MLKRINFLTLKTFIGPMIMSLAIIEFILVLQFMAVYVDELAGKGVGMEIIGKMFLYAAGHLLIEALPVAILAASLMTFGGMGEHNELAAIKSSGISLWRSSRFLVGFSLLIAFTSMAFSFEVLPQSRLKFFSLLYDVGRKKADLALKPGLFYYDIDNYVIRVSDKNPDRGILYDVVVYEHSPNRRQADVTLADSARLETGKVNQLKMVLYRGVRHESLRDDRERAEANNGYGRTYFDSLIYSFPLAGFNLDRTDEGLFSKHRYTLPFDKLVGMIDTMRKENNRRSDQFRRYLSPYNHVDTGFVAYRRTTSTAAPEVEETRYVSKEEKQRRYKALQDSLAGDSISVTEFLARKKRKSAKPEAPRPAPPDSTAPPDSAEEAAVFSFTYPAFDNVLDAFDDKQRADIVSRTITQARSIQKYAEYQINSRRDDDNQLRRYRHEMFYRIAIPLMCVVFMLIGVSLGAIVRKGGLGVPALISVACLALSYVFNHTGKKLAGDGVINPVLGAFLPVLVFLPLALLLLYESNQDGGLLREGVFAQFRSKVIGRLQNPSGIFGFLKR